MKPLKEHKLFHIPYGSIDELCESLQEEGYIIRDPGRGLTEREIRRWFSFGTDTEKVGEIRQVGEIRNVTYLTTVVHSWNENLTALLEESIL